MKISDKAPYSSNLEFSVASTLLRRHSYYFFDQRKDYLSLLETLMDLNILTAMHASLTKHNLTNMAEIKLNF